ncbi:PD-(D/E)XK motif protein [Bosea vaviloviae]|uniref:PD-(D/E)XK motif protein n=1 Tax=Bosea vaviloviae TaxID=1526658 RepID=A0A0N1F169_9HYPH|nr:PD-(D/E)XK motif protein [Bosea vaviloviae]KPH77317.1 hypothetical protein AE618_22430 [Bosea vaviloviae]
MNNPTFEALRDDLEALQAPDGEARNLRWLSQLLAVARGASGDYEIFLRGAELVATSPLVRRHLQHGEWQPQSGGDPFPATRIVLPSAPHFASVAALIAVELLRAGLGVGDDSQAAFSDVEPIIEMAIRRGALPENVIIGLIGELIVLRQSLLSIGSQDHLKGIILEAWQGWQPGGGRDFIFGANSIEVKTTQSVSSIHEFSGFHQLEAAQLPSGAQEQLHLLSVGLMPSTAMGESLPTIVDQVLAMLGNDTEFGPLQLALLTRVEAYGAANGVGYRHATMHDWSAYATRYTATFQPRLYRVADTAMRLLRREAVAKTFVAPASLSFAMHLPDQVSAFNPAPRWQQELAGMVHSL